MNQHSMARAVAAVGIAAALGWGGSALAQGYQSDSGAVDSSGVVTGSDAYQGGTGSETMGDSSGYGTGTTGDMSSGADAMGGSVASFSELDADQDGAVSLVEARNQITGDGLDDAFAAADADSDGKLDPAEFAAFQESGLISGSGDTTGVTPGTGGANGLDGTTGGAASDMGTGSDMGSGTSGTTD